MPTIEPASGPFGLALTVDVEEWFHNCFMPEYLAPSARPQLTEELDWLLPEVLELLDRHAAKATFFVLGELVGRHTAQLRQVVDAGHEVGSHGHLHYRVGDLDDASFFEDLQRSKWTLEDALGVEVEGYRAPEWSLRSVHNPRLERVIEAGYRYDSSLAPCWGVGRRENPRTVSWLTFAGARRLLEVPPTALWRRLRLPASGWLGRCVAPGGVQRALERHAAVGGLALFNVHPWELVDRPLPGRLRGMGRWAHDVGRRGFSARFESLLRFRRGGWSTIQGALAGSRDPGLAGLTSAAATAEARQRMIDAV